MPKPKLLIILGQTATGKSDFAVEIANHLPSKGRSFGEIISADSRQVYKGMDLGTGKITNGEMRGVSHHMLDVVSPKKIFSVSDYKKLAEKKIKEIIRRGKVPIIVGGTGFYIDALVNGNMYPEVPPNNPLRKKLYSKSAIALFEYIQKLDPERAKSIDKHNKVRLVRAIEIAEALGKVPALAASNNYEVIKIGLVLPDEILKEKIRARLLARMKKGMLKEIENLHTGGISWKRLDDLGLEYRYGAQYLQGKITKQEMIEIICIETWHYAKRQKTWFKRDKDTIWIDPRKITARKNTLKKVKEFLK